MQISQKSGLVLAATAAALLLSGAVGTPAAKAAEQEGKCIGVNSCKGTSACKSASNECKGHNACKGKGWVKMTKADCDASKGVFERAFEGN